MTQRFFGFLLVLVILPVAAGFSAAQARGTPESFADLVEVLAPAVVSISTESFIGAQGEGLPEGTPFDEFFQEFFIQKILMMPNGIKLLKKVLEVILM